jgi:hypothetical protein
MAVKRRKGSAKAANTIPEEAIMGDLEPDWALDEHDLGAIIDLEAEPEPAPAPTKPKKKRAPAKKKVHVPLSAPPFQILLFNPTERKYKWIDKWDGRKAPGPADLRGKYGPGRYEVRDDLKNSERWDIGASPLEAGASPPQALEPPQQPEIEADHESPAPPRIYPHEPPPWANVRPPYGAPPSWTASSATPGAGAPYDWPHHQPPPPPPPAPAGPDPQMMGTIYRLDAAIQQIAADQRRIQDELRSVTYELQQVPTRVAERVSSAIENASDPFDQMSKVWEMSSMIADGYSPGAKKEDEGGLAGLAEGVLSALASKMGPPPPGLNAPNAAPPQPPPPNGAGGTPAQGIGEGEPELPGMTQEIRQELLAHAASRGLSYADAIGMAKRNGWTAPDLLHLARNPPPNAPGQAPGQ